MKTVISRCVICRKYESPSFPLPNNAPLALRKSDSIRSIPVCGIRLSLTSLCEVRNLIEEGMGVLIYCTCLTVRAVHLEWMLDLIAVQFLSYLRRFVSRRGKLDLIISDNTPQFKLTNTP